MNKIIIEACVASVESAVAAARGGADRLELNAALELDGLTPSFGLFKEVRAACDLPIIVMIRPRGQGFAYSPHEYAIMLEDIKQFKRAGADGFALGFLTDNFEIDAEKTSEAVKLAGPCEVVFHRAFDVTQDATTALESLIDCGVHRVLTSGQQSSAPEGISELKALQTQSDGSIEILPGAGIKPSNVVQVLQDTGCSQVHGTFRKSVNSVSVAGGLASLKALPPAGTDAGIVSKVRTLCDAAFGNF